jgi:hypothetical protein
MGHGVSVLQTVYFIATDWQAIHQEFLPHTMETTFKMEHAAACSILKIVFVVDEPGRHNADNFQDGARGSVFHS